MKHFSASVFSDPVPISSEVSDVSQNVSDLVPLRQLSNFAGNEI